MSDAAGYRIAVRELCEFAAKQGDLDLRFTPSPSAEEGMAGHAAVVARRGEGYQAELRLDGEHGLLRIHGRCDGYDAAAGRVEEIKTYRGELAAMPANHRALHWAQAKVYGHLLCRRDGLAGLKVALVYYHVDRQHETALVEDCSAAELAEHFAALCGRFLRWAEQELAHRAARDAALERLAFPYPAFHHNQRELAETCYKAARLGRSLLAEAPTGVGKTLATLFPLLKAMPGRRLDKLFFLAAKTSGRQLALDGLAQLFPGLAQRSSGSIEPGPESTQVPQTTPIRVLELVARDKACLHPDLACHGDSCPLARGFYDRLPAARAEAVAAGRLDQAGLRAVAEAHAVCPYYLGQELTRWADVAVGDYNYFFDVTALLHGLRQAGGWRVGVLVDEAHNLVERGRAMYTAELDQAAYAALRKTAPAALKRHFDKLQRGWNAFNAAQAEPYRAYAEPPQALLAALQQLALAIGDHLNQRPDQLDPPLQRAQFDALHFLRMADCFGPHSLFDASLRPAAGARRKPASTLCLRNLVPAPFLAPRFAAAQSCVLFSATLSPADYYREMLGLPEDTPRLEVESPFRAEQLAVRVAPRISTRYGDRAGSLAPIAALLARQYRAEPGNYLAFFSSFAYLEQALAELARQAPDIPCWAQTRGMDEPARRDFLARFTPDGRGIGFAVLGGAFAEGIDLRGPRLIGAFIATLGLPQLNPVNEQLRQRLHELFGRGYEYAYLYPGLQKVVQAAGRVIRGTEDRGVVYLLDDRYAEARVAALLPAWWRVEFDADGEAGSP